MKSYVNTISFSKNAVTIIRLLHFYEAYRYTIDETGNVRTEVVAALPVFAGKLCSYVPIVFLTMFIVYQLNTAISRKLLIEISAQVLVC